MYYFTTYTKRGSRGGGGKNCIPVGKNSVHNTIGHSQAAIIFSKFQVSALESSLGGLSAIKIQLEVSFEPKSSLAIDESVNHYSISN